MSGICDGRVVLITGAGRGIGRAHALAFAAEGARVVVNDLGAALDGGTTGENPAEEVVAEIVAAGGEAIADDTDITNFSSTKSLIDRVIERYGTIEVIVNNAGMVRDRMFFSLSEDDWDDVMRVHLKGHFCLARHAAEYWRELSKSGSPVEARIINTSSGAGILGSVGQSNYSAAKAGIVGLTLVQSAELGRYGVTANALAPAARTRMTETVFADTMTRPEDGSWDAMAPENVSPFVVWLGSTESAGVTGRVFEVEAGKIGVADGWQHGPEVDKGARWEVGEIGSVVRDLLDKAPLPSPVYGA